MERGSLGAKALKYDTGADSACGSRSGAAMTLYTQDAGRKACLRPSRIDVAPAARALGNLGPMS